MAEFNIAFKKTLPDAKTPKYAHSTDACLDLFAATDGTYSVGKNGQRIMYDTGIAVQIPDGYVGLVFPRSSIGTKTGLALANSIGVIDCGYQASIKVNFNVISKFGDMYKKGDAIAQIMIIPRPQINLVEVEEFIQVTARGEGGMGSTGDGQDR